MPPYAASRPVNTQEVMAKWLDETFDFTHFVTLTSNDSMLGVQAMRERLKRWDARVNRDLYGPKWLKHHDELIWYFAFLEKPGVNPHWHLLLRLVGKWNSDTVDDFKRLSFSATKAWTEIMPSGTADVQLIQLNSFGTVEDYVVKELPGEIQYQHFLVPDEFRSK